MAKKIYWRKLDDQAKIFILASNKYYSSIFRLSVVLNEKVDSEILSSSVKMALEKNKAFKVKLCRGLFWHYLEENTNDPVVSIENDYPFKKINARSNNRYLFKITYFENKINIDFSHVLTDANGGSKFFIEIINLYLSQKYKIDLEIETDYILKDTSNSYDKLTYIKNFVKKDFRRAYILKGKTLPHRLTSITHLSIDLYELKKYSQKEMCSVSVLLVAMIVYSIYESQYKNTKGKQPIKICVPINLNNYCETKSLSNFISYMSINIKPTEKDYTFNEILNETKKEFETKLNKQNAINTVCLNMKLLNYPITRIVPLFMKKVLFNLGSLEVKIHNTMSFSNIGVINSNVKTKKYIKKFFTILSADWAEKMKCGVCSYENELVVTFTSKLVDKGIINEFKGLLDKKKIKYIEEGNEISDLS